MNSLMSPINPSRVRRLPKFYSWIDHRIVHEGHLKKLSCEAAAMYLFLLTVGDRFGMSYYSDRAIYKRVNISDAFAVRQELINADLIAYAKPVYQVLSLPDKRPQSSVKKEVMCAEAPATDEEITVMLTQFIGGGR